MTSHHTHLALIALLVATQRAGAHLVM
jgi:hypothetical protein